MFAATKSVCPISLAQFAADAGTIDVTIAGQTFTLEAKAPFSTGSFGYYGNGKVELEIAGQDVRFQVGITVTACNSKEAPRA